MYKGQLFERIGIMDARTVLEILMWTLGPLVMLTYMWLYYVMSAYTYEKRSRPWAPFGENGPYFWIWAASGLLCVISFLHLWLCYFYGCTELQAYDWLLYPYWLFLGFSALYAPVIVLGTLGHAVGCGGGFHMRGRECDRDVRVDGALSHIHRRGHRNGDDATCVLTAWLAFHYTVLDAELGDTHGTISKDTGPRTVAGSRCPYRHASTAPPTARLIAAGITRSSLLQ